MTERESKRTGEKNRTFYHSTSQRLDMPNFLFVCIQPLEIRFVNFSSLRTCEVAVRKIDVCGMLRDSICHGPGHHYIYVDTVPQW